MNYNNPYYNTPFQQENKQQQQTQQVQQPQGQQPAYTGYYQTPPLANSMVQGIPQSQSVFPGGVPGQNIQQTQQVQQPQGQVQNNQPNYISPYENHVAPMDASLADAKVQAGLSINERSDKGAIIRYMSTATDTIHALKRESLDYKALWMEANTANIKLRRDNEYLHEQVQLTNQIKTQQLEVDQQRQRQDFQVNQSRNQLRDMLEEDWQNHIKNGKI
jgi:hypothetical protein